MEAAKNAFNHVMGYDKEESSGDNNNHHTHHHLPGHHKNEASTDNDSGSAATETPSKPVSAGNSGSNDHQGNPEDQDQDQSSDKGPDPALVGEPNPTEKLSGNAAPGSHSAVFGLTPDGKKSTDTSHGTSAPKPAHGSDDSAQGGGKKEEGGDTSSRNTASGEVGEQMQKAEADQGEKGLQRTDPAPQPAGSDGKPGAGATGLQQGSGKV
ncbi:uncharacterized protein Z520_09190 [Fonsecaea multimorphosa CBS 102226]|uniref:Uncharacterized protein n=1 Tax=Fonsecaea multimorphosa CBS 102226 TaxID=1442371 RepID=A0A0D2KEZ5_9EURO|nr:uncharacterized protein Z520_09190 [Fonsecaea multimorphosa CBS 102226]KIX95273.1 hypothetical protein Z520_09190 [Fonsecaea multimorphosa CBS 102226]OAL17237.1 hypothetical protein AYO22_11802 [Fonsecaea multimorphosa]